MGGRRAHGSQKGNRRRELPDQFDCGYQVLAKPAIAQILLKPIPFLSPPLPFQASSSHPSCLYQTLEAFAGPSNSHPRHYVRPFLPPDHIARRDTTQTVIGTRRLYPWYALLGDICDFHDLRRSQIVCLYGRIHISQIRRSST